MKNQTETTKAGQQYAAAYAMHYKNKNLNEALDLYEGLMAAHPDTNEAEYSRTQIQNIAKSLVPKQELLDAEIAMARAHLKH
jgi:hypothetical protein